MPKSNINRKESAKKHARPGWEHHTVAQISRQHVAPALAGDAQNHALGKRASELEKREDDEITVAARDQAEREKWSSCASQTDTQRKFEYNARDQERDNMDRHGHPHTSSTGDPRTGEPFFRADHFQLQYRSSVPHFLRPYPILNSRYCSQPAPEFGSSTVIFNPLSFFPPQLVHSNARVPVPGSLETQLLKYCPELFVTERSQVHFPQARDNALASVGFAPAARGVATLAIANPSDRHLQFLLDDFARSRLQPPLNLAMLATSFNQDIDRLPNEKLGHECRLPQSTFIAPTDSHQTPQLFRFAKSLPGSETDNSNDQISSMKLACPEDRGMLNEHLIFLRQQIEFFPASLDDTMSHTRGRNKDIALRQVGVRCRYCSHIAVGQRRKGSTYFPSTLMGIYQAAQNINIEHLQSGICPEMPREVERVLLTTRASKTANSGAGKAYWAESARMQGLVDTEDGIRFAADAANSMLFAAS